MDQSSVQQNPRAGDKYQDWKNQVDRHILVIPPETQREKSRFEDQFERIMTAYYTDLDNGRIKNKGLIYLNGGLNSAQIVKDQAANQIPCIINESKSSPIFLIWDSSWTTAYVEQKAHIRNGRFQRAGKITTPVDGLGDIGQGFIRAPVVFFQEFFLFADTFLNKNKFRMFPYRGCNAQDVFCTKTKNDTYGGGKGLVRLDNNVLIGESSDRERRLPRFFATLLYGITLIPRLVISPFVDSIGKATWEDLVRRTRNTIRDPMDLQPDLQLVDPEKKERYLKDFEKYPFGTGLFARLFHELDICVNDMTKECGRGFLEKDMAKKVRKSLKASEITLIGHSMGTIVLNELLRVYPRLPYENIVYMAAASSMSDFYRSVIPLLEKDKEGDGKKRGLRFYSLLLHPYAEATERFAGGMAPDGSLLEWVDGELRSLRYHNADILWQCALLNGPPSPEAKARGLTEFVLESRQLRLGLIPKSFGRKSNR